MTDSLERDAVPEWRLSLISLLCAINIASTSLALFARWRAICSPEKHFSSISCACEIKRSSKVFRCSPEIKGASHGHATGGRTLKNVFQRGFPFPLFSFLFYFFLLIFCRGINVITKLPTAPRFGRPHEWYMPGISTNSPGKHCWISLRYWTIR